VEERGCNALATEKTSSARHKRFKLKINIDCHLLSERVHQPEKKGKEKESSKEKKGKSGARGGGGEEIISQRDLAPWNWELSGAVHRDVSVELLEIKGEY